MREKKAAFVFLLVFALVAAGMSGCLGGAGAGASSAANTQTVTLKVDASAASEAGYTGEAVLFEGEVSLPEGGKVEDALVAAGLVFDNSSGYFSSIGGLAEKAYGAESGWMYTVNGDYPTEGNATLKDGDVVHLVYALSFQM